MKKLLIGLAFSVATLISAQKNDIQYYIDLVKSLFSKPNKIDKKFEEEIQVFLLNESSIYYLNFVT